MRRPAAILLTLVAVLLGTAPLAMAATPKVNYNTMESQFMCVSCNVSLTVAESPQASQEKGELHDLVNAGLDEQQIKDRLVAIYGPAVLADPPAKGFNLFAYIVPIAVALALILLGLLLLPRWLRARRDRHDDDDDDPSGGIAAADEQRLESDMARLGI
jgi:cytochrome c-type biogenesis protein CcmH/NrfF